MDSHAMLRLTETDGGGNSTELSTIKVSELTITIGRSNEADLCFGEDDQSVSRHQFEVSFSGGAPTLKNTGRNPVVYKNGRKQLASGSQINIVSGLELTFSESKLRFDVEVPEVYCLRTKGAGGRATFEIECNRKYTVGRSPECDITLDSSGVSRRHCKIQIEPTEILKVRDLGSVNGVRLFLKGEVQEESSDIEVPCGVKFIIGDIECIWNRKGQGTSKKKLIALSVFLLLLLFASFSYFGLKSDGSDKRPSKNNEPEKKVSSTVVQTSQGTSNQEESQHTEKKQQKAGLERQQKISRIQVIIRDDVSFDQKAERFAGLAKEPGLKDLVPLCNQLVRYYSQCSMVEKLNGSSLKKYEQRKEETRRSIEQMEFDFNTTLSFEMLKDDGDKLKVSYDETVAALMQEENDIEVPEFPRELTDDTGQLVEKADEYEEKARSLSFIWTDLENSSFSPSKFDKEVMMTSIDTLYPGEGIGSEVCAKIDEIIDYRGQMSVAYQGLIGQIGSVLTNYIENGVSEQLLPERLAMKPLRDAIETPLPKYFEEPPPITDVSTSLYNHLDAISTKWTNLEFLTYCGRWKSGLEQRKSAFAKINEVVPLIDQLCVEASLKCAADLDKGINPYKTIKSKLESGEELGFNDARKLIRVYDLCYEYLQNDLFCELRKESKKDTEAVSADTLNRLYEQLKKECDDGSMALDASEKGICVQNAKRILEILDSAACLPPDFKTKIKDYRKWADDSDVKN